MATRTRLNVTLHVHCLSSYRAFILLITYYMYQQMHIYCIIKYQIILQTLLRVSVLLNHLQGALILHLLNL
jgi:hypothetical protein